MDSISPIPPIPIEPVPSLSKLDRLAPRSSRNTTDSAALAQLEDRKKEVARQFESVLLTQLLNEMKNTVGQWGTEKDGAAQQVDGIFWSHLGQTLGEQGGMGLWKQIYQDMGSAEVVSSKEPELEEII